jgi:hypothetical protein
MAGVTETKGCVHRRVRVIVVGPPLLAYIECVECDYLQPMEKHPSGGWCGVLSPGATVIHCGGGPATWRG